MILQEKEYRPPKWLYVFTLIGTIVIPIGLVLLAKAKLDLTSGFLWIFSFVGVLVMVDLFISRVVIHNDRIDMIGLFTRKTIQLTELETVKLEDRSAVILMKNGHYVRMPPWFNKASSFQATVNHRKGKA